MNATTEIRKTIAWRLWLVGFKYRTMKRETPDTVARAIAYRLPRRIVYWTTMRAYSVAWMTIGNKEPDELTFSDVLAPWEETPRDA